MKISKFYIHRQVRDTPQARCFQERLKMSPTVVDDVAEVYRQVLASDDPVSAGKRTLFLTRNRGSFIRDCPGTQNYACCGYKILHIGTYCTMDCAYCILQSYFHPPLLQFFVNQQDLYAELDQYLARPGIARMGTGEFTDSLIWQIWTDTASELVERFSRQRHAVLELKTKTTAIEALDSLQHNRKTILSWSLNTPRIIASEERSTASLEARLQNARRCQEWGYPLAFHFDPMIIYDGCREEYLQVVERLFNAVSADGVVWISLGTFRFMPALKTIIETRFPLSKIVYGEFIGGLDGKMRYFKRLRIGLYRSVVEHIKLLAPGVTVYLCMEDDEVWQKAFGFVPSGRGGIGGMLDRSAMAHCWLKL